GTGLPLPFYVWVDSWLPHRHLTQGKLVRLLGTSGKAPSKDPSQTYFREVARLGNLALEERECALNGTEVECPTERNGVETRTRGENRALSNGRYTQPEHADLPA